MDSDTNKVETVQQDESNNQKGLETSQYVEVQHNDNEGELLKSQTEMLHASTDHAQNLNEQSLGSQEQSQVSSAHQAFIISVDEKKTDENSSLTWSVLKQSGEEEKKNDEKNVELEVNEKSKGLEEHQIHQEHEEAKIDEGNEKEPQVGKTTEVEGEEVYEPEKKEVQEGKIQEESSARENNEEAKAVTEEKQQAQPENQQAQPEQQPVENVDTTGTTSTAEKMKSDAEFSLLTNERLLKKATELKDSARENIGRKDYEGAIKIYEEALQIIHPSHFKNSQDHIMKELITLTVILMNNLGLCFYNINQAKRCLEYSDQALLIDPKNIKANYRKALVYKNLTNDIERAFEFMRIARKCCIEEKKPSEEIEKEYTHIKDLYLQYKEKNKEKQKELYSKMLSNPDKKKEKKDSENNDKSANASTNSDNESSTSGNPVKKMFWLFPSSLISLGVTNYLLKQKIKSSTGTCSLLFLTCSLAGVFVSKSNYLKASSLGASMLYILYNMKVLKK